MLLLILGLVIFLGTHSFTMVRSRRAALVDRLGEGPYRIAYSVVSLIGLVLIIYGFGLYRRTGWVQVWSPPVWTRHLALLLVWAAFVSLAAAYVPGRIKAMLKHPMLVAVKLWATAHLIANGDLGGILLFGTVLAWAVLARISLKRRPDEVADHGGPIVATSGWRGDIAAIAIGSVAWFVFARWLHPWWIGLVVWPGT